VTSVASAGIVGLGLMGGSLARDLSARGVRVLGWDRDGSTVARAMEAGAVAGPLRGEAVDVLVLAVPVLDALNALAGWTAQVRGVRLITDLGSTKAAIVARAEALGVGDRFVGAHPLAGGERCGWGASRTGLYEGARVYLTPAPSCAEGVVSLAHALWAGLGARTETVDAAEHDRRLAWSSHLPQAVSSALAAALAGAGVPREALGPGGRDVTRLAGSSPELWAQVAADNRANLAPALAAVEAELRELRMRLDGGDLSPLRAWFALGGRG
jgi:prephenate dehydrogenase